MSESISYKRPIKIRNNLSSQRRSALKDFYKLQSKQKTEIEQLDESELKATTKENATQESSLNDQELNKFINQSSISEILKKENEIIAELNSNQAEIKSIIYNNYYELIKLNQILTNLNDSDQQKHDNIDMVKSFEDIKSSITSFNDFDQEFSKSEKDDKNTQLSQSISKLLAQDQITESTMNQIQDLLSKLKYGEHDVLILQLNELKSKVKR